METNTTDETGFILPPHENKMTISIISALFCFIGGIIAIIFASNSNTQYNAAMATSDEGQKKALYNQSIESNKTAHTLSIVSFVVGGIGILGYIIFWYASLYLY